ncbi:efflux RND transporter periplasmic adaptor subunit [Marinoscillum sp. MHG1-6]|uniref:efflux RND transporter periplasmic adaptor subunit n=1 Tax=Marinoscillum sp. MHG1-6 TaxID=2959627 RepID=UPI0021589582|nr:efflux RND transporter periplasmic adaptor subunit [Marinoscillum sp. MHG1-6]
MTKKIIIYLGVILLISGAGYAGYYFISTNNKPVEPFETSTPFIATIEKKSVATGKVIPEDEVEIKPNLSGIIDKVFLEEGQQVKAGDLIALIKVVPNEASINQAKGRVSSAQIVLKNAKTEYERNLALYEKGVIADQAFRNAELNYLQAEQELKNAQSDLQIIVKGTAGGGTANTQIRSTVDGTILEIPVKAGDQVIESNNFNEGTSIATVANLDRMIFEGQVDESEVGKLKPGMALEVSLAAISDETFEAKLKFIAPKGTEQEGTVQFKIKADVDLKEEFFIRAGYSANASMITGRKDSVLSVKEAWLQYDKKTDEPFVEIETGEQQFERRNVKLGLSDGLNVEVIGGVKETDKIKIWNKTVAEKIKNIEYD